MTDTAQDLLIWGGGGAIVGFIAGQMLGNLFSLSNRDSASSPKAGIAIFLAIVGAIIGAASRLFS